ncbi:hypothetical protein ACFX1X_025194 [Malus domestica]
MLLGRSWFLKLWEYLGNFRPVGELNLGVKPHSEFLTLSVTASYPPNINYMIKAIYKHLMSKEDQNADHLTDNHINCLQQRLKSVKIKRLNGTKNGQKFYGEDLSMLLTDLEEVKAATFELNWLSEN